jgi:NAD(P)-dependent dehydrogenase (short-subunit alcohol dehydrogenase family)
MMQNHTILITGTNRGIGLEFTKQYAEAGWHVHACCREPQSSAALMALANQYPNIHLHALDVSDFSQMTQLSNQLKALSIDALINNAGVYPEQLNTSEWLNAFLINAIAPYEMVKAFLPQIRKGNLRKIATLSSKMGSIDDNTSGGSYAYRSSKVAANMVMKSLSVDLVPEGIAVVMLHPGWVLTDMGGPNALIDTKTSVTGMRKVIEKLSLANTGKFIAYDGKEIPW